MAIIYKCSLCDETLTRKHKVAYPLCKKHAYERKLELQKIRRKVREKKEYTLNCISCDEEITTSRKLFKPLCKECKKNQNTEYQRTRRAGIVKPYKEVLSQIDIILKNTGVTREELSESIKRTTPYKNLLELEGDLAFASTAGELKRIERDFHTSLYVIADKHRAYARISGFQNIGKRIPRLPYKDAIDYYNLKIKKCFSCEEYVNRPI